MTRCIGAPQGPRSAHRIGMEHAMKYCDLVMKGGITSGIVYPNAVLALAREFRFKSVGGTSAGAIAAAVTAAAACGDRRKSMGNDHARCAGRGLRRPGRGRRATDDARVHRAPVPARVGRTQRLSRAGVRDGHGVAMEEDRRDLRRDHGDGAARIPARVRLAARAGLLAGERRRVAGDAVAVVLLRVCGGGDFGGAARGAGRARESVRSVQWHVRVDGDRR